LEGGLFVWVVMTAVLGDIKLATTPTVVSGVIGADVTVCTGASSGVGIGW